MTDPFRRVERPGDRRVYVLVFGLCPTPPFKVLNLHAPDMVSRFCLSSGSLTCYSLHSKVSRSGGF